MLEELDELVRKGLFPSRSEVIRIAIRDLLLREIEKIRKSGTQSSEESEISLSR